MKFDEYSGIIKVGNGYSDIARVDRDRLIELLNRLPAGDIFISSVPHKAGRCVIAKPVTETEPHWHALAPMKPKKEKKE